MSCLQPVADLQAPRDRILLMTTRNVMLCCVVGTHWMGCTKQPDKALEIASVNQMQQQSRHKSPSIKITCSRPQQLVMLTLIWKMKRSGCHYPQSDGFGEISAV